MVAIGSICLYAFVSIKALKASLIVMFIFLFSFVLTFDLNCDTMESNRGKALCLPSIILGGL